MRVEVEVALLDVLAVVPFGAGQPEEALLEDRVLAVPQREREAEAAFAIGDAEQAVLAPAVGAASRVIVGEVVPAIARGRVVLAHGPPLALGEVRPPALPVLLALRVFEEAPAFGVGHGRLRRSARHDRPSSAAHPPRPDPTCRGVVREIARRDRAPHVEDRRRDAPRGLDRVGAVKEGRVARHRVVEQALVPGRLVGRTEVGVVEIEIRPA